MSSSPLHAASLFTYYNELVNTWTRKLNNRQEAEDLTQDALLRVLEARVSPAQPRAYLHQTARNIAIDAFRRDDGRAPWLPLDDIEPDPAASGDPEAAMQAVQLADRIEQALAELPQKCRQVFVWQRLEGCSQQEIAERLDISKNMVEKYMIRATRHLRDRLDPHVPAARRRARWRGTVAAALCVLGIATGWMAWRFDAQPDTQVAATSAQYADDFRTPPGERRTFMLPDGSKIELNTRSRVRVRFEDGRRNVELAEGEAMFEVARDTARPFVIDAGQATVTVTGTRFDVRRDAAGVDVTVESGSVRVAGQRTATLTAGLATHVDANGAVAAPAPVDVAATLSWREGKLMFRDQPLSEVGAEVSRYRTHPVRVADAATGRLRLTSVFNADDTNALLAALPQILPVSVRTLPDGTVEIFSR